MGSFGTTSSAILRSEHGAGSRRPAFSIDLPVPPLEVARAGMMRQSAVGRVHLRDVAETARLRADRVVPMTVRIDPEGNETDALFDLVELEGREVLEIGCGDGRLTRRYADRAAHVTAIDPFEDSIARAAQRWRSEAPNERIEFRHVAFEDFVAASDAAVFDVTLLSWSLC
jgi:2-polyprenyl-3-methyl-5-hydroxy-6-metoxy-1,4-benzoquinol methylase